MNGYGSHTYSFWNAAGERHWVKFHFKTLQGHRFLTNDQAATVVGQSRETFQEDLYGAIERGDFPKWKLQVQIMPERDAEKTIYNPFDLTKVWPHADYPPIDVGIMELNRNPDNYFAEIEQAAFSPSNVVPGIGFARTRCCRRACSPTPTLTVTGWARITRRCRSTRRMCQCITTTRMVRCGSSATTTANPDAYYEPNSFNGPQQDPSVREPPLHISGDADRYNHRDGNDDYSQVTALFRLFDDGQRQRLFSNMAASMRGVPNEIIERQLGHLARVDQAYATGVRAALAANITAAAAE